MPLGCNFCGLMKIFWTVKRFSPTNPKPYFARLEEQVESMAHTMLTLVEGLIDIRPGT
jgi:hypothetical protein